MTKRPKVFWIVRLRFKRVAWDRRGGWFANERSARRYAAKMCAFPSLVEVEVLRVAVEEDEES